jgi:hypothetical protein
MLLKNVVLIAAVKAEVSQVGMLLFTVLLIQTAVVY